MKYDVVISNPPFHEGRMADPHLGGKFIAAHSISDGMMPLIVMTVIALLFGIHMVMAIGGADMPVVVSMLNSYSGWAAAGIGFSLNNSMLIIAGSLVGSSGGGKTTLFDAVSSTAPQRGELAGTHRVFRECTVQVGLDEAEAGQRQRQRLLRLGAHVGERLHRVRRAGQAVNPTVRDIATHHGQVRLLRQQ